MTSSRRVSRAPSGLRSTASTTMTRFYLTRDSLGTSSTCQPLTASWLQSKVPTPSNHNPIFSSSIVSSWHINPSLSQLMLSSDFSWECFPGICFATGTFATLTSRDDSRKFFFEGCWLSGGPSSQIFLVTNNLHKNIRSTLIFGAQNKFQDKQSSCVNVGWKMYSTEL